MDNIGKFFDKIRVMDCKGLREQFDVTSFESESREFIGGRFAPLTKIRIGNPNDGGYVAYQEICERAKEVYTFGVGDDVSFELDFLNRFSCTKFHLYDPTITGLPVTNPAFTFHKIGLPQAYHWPGLKDVKPGSLLKIDVEWCEWESLELFDVELLRKFDQILIELHLFTVDDPANQYSPYFTGVFKGFSSGINSQLFERYGKVMDKLLEHFHIFHAHPNNSLPKKRVHITPFAPLLELSLVRKDLVGEFKEAEGPFPAPGLDAPNKTDRPDIENYYPLWRIS